MPNFKGRAAAPGPAACPHPAVFTLNRSVKANGRAVRAGFDDLIQTVEGAAANEENVGGIDLDHLLLGMLPPSLRRHVGHRTFYNFQQRLLHAFTGHISGDRSIFALSSDFIHLVDVNNSALRQINVKIRSLKKAQKNILHILAHIARLCQGSGIGDGKGHIENLGQGLGKQRLAATGRSDQQNIALLQLHIRVAPKVNPLIVVVNRHRQGNLCRFLAHNVAIHKGFDLLRRRQRLRNPQFSRLRLGRVRIIQKGTANPDTVAANIYAGTGNHPLHLSLSLPAEGAADSCSSRLAMHILRKLSGW